MTRTASIAALIATSLIAAPLALASELTVNVEGIAEAQGSISLGLFDAGTYDGNGAVNGANLTFSNDAKGRFGPAKWDDAKFSVTADGAVHTITMN